MFFTGIVGAV